jgi:general secretion pathway protein K
MSPKGRPEGESAPKRAARRGSPLSPKGRPEGESAPKRAAPVSARTLPAAQDGIALVLALWLTVLLTVLASGFAFSMRSEALAARNAVSLATARTSADGAVERTAFELLRPRVANAWTFDGQPHSWKDGDATIVVSAVDEASKIDINRASDLLLRNLLIVIGGADEASAMALVDSIADWRDPDELRRPYGAEAPEYEAAGLKYRPTNTQFATASEVARVLGMTREVYDRIAPSITVYSRQPGINPATASRSVLLALPSATPELVDQFIENRAQALANRLPVPPFPPAQAFGSGPVPVWRIHAEATLPDGVTFVREAVLRPSPDPRRPLITLAWSEPSRSAPAPSLAAANR